MLVTTYQLLLFIQTRTLKRSRLSACFGLPVSKGSRTAFIAKTLPTLRLATASLTIQDAHLQIGMKQCRWMRSLHLPCTVHPNMEAAVRMAKCLLQESNIEVYNNFKMLSSCWWLAGTYPFLVFKWILSCSAKLMVHMDMMKTLSTDGNIKTDHQATKMYLNVFAINLPLFYIVPSRS